MSNTTAVNPPASLTSARQPPIVTTIVITEIVTIPQTPESTFVQEIPTINFATRTTGVHSTDSNGNVMTSSPSATSKSQDAITSNPIDFKSTGFIIAYVIAGIIILLVLIISILCRKKANRGESLAQLQLESATAPSVYDKKYLEATDYQHRSNVQNNLYLQENAPGWSGPKAPPAPFDARPSSITSSLPPEHYSANYTSTSYHPDNNRLSMLSAASHPTNYSNSNSTTYTAYTQNQHLQPVQQMNYQQAQPPLLNNPIQPQVNQPRVNHTIQSQVPEHIQPPLMANTTEESPKQSELPVMTSQSLL
ncbi:hypothetical protein HDV06_005064 [Boothiomyces sp. JEL0866]|nr:hypothetical protein HDV06_005064 [Boothiomyces sp. JEL0866]